MKSIVTCPRYLVLGAAVALATLSLGPGVARGETIATATFIPQGTQQGFSGLSISLDQWFGARFEFPEATEITAVGGYIISPGGELQGIAVVALGSDGLPVTDDPEDALFHALFVTSSSLASEVSIPTPGLVVEGAIGVYFYHDPALGTTGSGGALPTTGDAIDDTLFRSPRYMIGDFFHDDAAGWLKFPESNFSEGTLRIVIETALPVVRGPAPAPDPDVDPGSGSVPEPATAGCLVLSAVTLALRRRRTR